VVRGGRTPKITTTCVKRRKSDRGSRVLFFTNNDEVYL
jgi:hypothetical protein